MKLRLLHAVLLGFGMVSAPGSAHSANLPVASFTMGGSGLTPFYVLGFELGPWQDYLARELTPGYLIEADSGPLNISWMDADAVMILPAFAEDLVDRPAYRYRMQIEWQSVRGPQPAEFRTPFNAPGLGFERQLLAPGLSHHLDTGGLLDVSAVFAYQSFGVANLGMKSYDRELPGFMQPTQYAPYQESGYGTGVRLAVHQQLGPGMEINAGYQSRIDMEEFASFNGVYSQPADLDIPARATLGLALQASDRSWFNVSVEHVMYGSIEAFPSRLLPDRFLSLLGDSTSPEFSWDDLTVYSIGWSWNNGEDTEWRFDISSRSQPLPTSRILSQALGSSMADSAMLIGYSRKLNDRARFSLNAAYAPAEYAFGGSVLGVVTEDLDQNVELEAFWTWDF